MTHKTARKDLLANVIVVGEGFDDLGRRYLIKPEQIYCDLGDAGCNLFSSRAQRGLHDLLQNHEQQEPSFSVATRLGSFGNFYVRPNEIIGHPSLPVEPVLGALASDMLQKYR